MKNSKTKKGILIAGVCVLAAVAFVIGWKLIVAPNESPGWHKDSEGASYYVGENGRPADGYCVVDGEVYYFDKGGKPAQEGWIDDMYYCEGEGKLTTGWRAEGTKVYYFYQKEDKGRELGEQARDYTTSGKIYIPEDGYVDGKKGEALAYGIDVLNKRGWTLEDAYAYASSLKFDRANDDTYGMKVENAAIQGFKHGEGNCLAWAGTFCVMAKLMGKDCREIWGSIKTADEELVHGWAEIWEEDGIHVYDPRKNDGSDIAGFDFHYGDKGSYRYDEENKNYLEW